jgi:hypothetical protein
VLTSHIASSVGWLGAVAVFLALALVGLTSQDPRTVRATYLVMEPAAWLTLVPLAFASQLTGLIQSLGTTWGLFRHYWVLSKLLINVGAIVVLLMYTQTLNYLAGVAAESTWSSDDLTVLRTPSVALHSVLALLLLLVATVRAVYKPRGVTPYGRRKQHERGTVSQP